MPEGMVSFTNSIFVTLNKIRCKIYYNNETIYDSKDLLYRDFLLFDDNKELKNNK